MCWCRFMLKWCSVWLSVVRMSWVVYVWKWLICCLNFDCLIV